MDETLSLLVVESFPEPLLVFERTGRGLFLVETNRAARAVGIEAGERTERTPQEALSTAGVACAPERIAELLETNGTLLCPAPLPDDPLRRLVVEVLPLERGLLLRLLPAPGGLTASGDDRWRALVEMLPFPAYLADPQTAQTLWLSPQAAELLGLDGDACTLDPQVLRRHVHPEDRTQVDESLRRTGRTGDALRLEYRLLVGDGEVLWVREDVRCVTGGDARLLQGILQEVTARRKYEEESRTQLDRLQRALRLREELFAIASHELRGPLTALRVQVQRLARASGRTLTEEAGPRLGEVVGTALRQVLRMNRMVDTLLDAARVSAGRLSLVPEPTDLALLVREVVEDVGAQMPDALAFIHVDTPERLVGEWDRLRLWQVITNLLTNAIRYAPRAPIEVVVAQRDEHAVVEVRDHGPGIAPDEVERIFDRWERGGRRDENGLGLGLFITREIVEAHQGTIRVLSRPGGGATFVVELPHRAA